VSLIPKSGAVRGNSEPRNSNPPFQMKEETDASQDPAYPRTCNPASPVECGAGNVKPVRLQLLRKKGFNLQALSRATNGLPAVNCTRPGSYANPFRLLNEEGSALIEDTRDGSAWGVPWDDAEKQVVLAFERHIDLPENAGFRAEAIADLRRKNLACWCHLDQPFCHVNVWLRIANAPSAEAS
jgi:hypothetical protein